MSYPLPVPPLHRHDSASPPRSPPSWTATEPLELRAGQIHPGKIGAIHKGLFKSPLFQKQGRLATLNFRLGVEFRVFSQIDSRNIRLFAHRPLGRAVKRLTSPPTRSPPPTRRLCGVHLDGTKGIAGIFASSHSPGNVATVDTSRTGTRLTSPRPAILARRKSRQ
jgi:hypothetical protein